MTLTVCLPVFSAAVSAKWVARRRPDGRAIHLHLIARDPERVVRRAPADHRPACPRAGRNGHGEALRRLRKATDDDPRARRGALQKGDERVAVVVGRRRQRPGAGLHAAERGRGDEACRRERRAVVGARVHGGRRRRRRALQPRDTPDRSDAAHGGDRLGCDLVAPAVQTFRAGEVRVAERVGVHGVAADRLDRGQPAARPVDRHLGIVGAVGRRDRERVDHRGALVPEARDRRLRRIELRAVLMTGDRARHLRRAPA